MKKSRGGNRHSNFIEGMCGGHRLPDFSKGVKRPRGGNRHPNFSEGMRGGHRHPDFSKGVACSMLGILCNVYWGFHVVFAGDLWVGDLLGKYWLMICWGDKGYTWLGCKAGEMKVFV